MVAPRPTQYLQGLDNQQALAACEALRQEIYSANRRAEAYADAARKNTEERVRHVTSIQELTEEIREYFFKLQTYIRACFAVPNHVKNYD